MYRQGEHLKGSQDTRNASVLRSWIERWVTASYANYDRIVMEMLRDKKDYSLLSYQNKHEGEPAIIVGAGISLEKLIPLLKDWKGVIFCPESLASTIQYYGHQPEYVCLFDAGTTAWEIFLKGYDWTGSTLVTHPCVAPEAIEGWKDDKIYYMMMHFAHLHKELVLENKEPKEIEAEIKQQLTGYDFFENMMPTVYKFIGASILNAGCVVNNAVEVANFMGYGPMFLCGVDYGFKDWVHRFPGVQKENGEWVKGEKQIVRHEEDEETIGEIDISREIIIGDNGVPTTDEQAEYKLALLSVYKLDRPQLFDCSDGLITELPKLDIAEVVEKNGRGFEENYRTNEEIVRCADAYFNRRKAATAE